MEHQRITKRIFEAPFASGDEQIDHKEGMAKNGRDDYAIAYTIMAFVGAIENNQNSNSHKGGLLFKGWIASLEAIHPRSRDKVTFGIDVLVEEVEYWWENTCAHLEVEMRLSLRISSGNVHTTKARQESSQNGCTYKGYVGLVKRKQSRGQSRRKECLKCGYHSHLERECADKKVTCFNYGKQGHITRSCTLPKRKPPSVGRSTQSRCSKTITRVFAFSDVEASKFENLVKGTCFVNCYPLVVLFDCGVISIKNGITSPIKILDFPMLRLELFSSSLKYKPVIETHANSSIFTSNCPLNVLNRDFLVDLICFPLSQLDIILDMD
ncbi:hypothetical protein CR513_46165, partial [Mucuna pruriens]